MKISFTDAGKRFNREWIFRHVNLQFNSGSSYAITGANGSGKSTLLQTVAGMLQLSEGGLQYQGIEDDRIFSAVSFCAPYCDVIDEMTLTEFLGFHSAFKTFIKDQRLIMEEVGLQHASEKQIRNYSSGMKQRVRLAQAVFTDTPVILLDEPASNLDEEGVALYHRLISKYCSHRLVIVCSNDEREYGFCNQVFRMEDFK